MPHLDPNKINEVTEVESVFFEDLYPKFCMGYGDLILLEKDHLLEAKESIRDTALKYLDTENELIGLGTMDDKDDKEFDSFCISHRKPETPENQTSIWISFTYFPELCDDIVLHRPGEGDIIFKAYSPMVHEKLDCPGCGEPLEYHLFDDLGIDTDNIMYFDEIAEEIEKKKKKKKSRKKKNDKKDEN